MGSLSLDKKKPEPCPANCGKTCVKSILILCRKRRRESCGESASKQVRATKIEPVSGMSARERKTASFIGSGRPSSRGASETVARTRILQNYPRAETWAAKGCLPAGNSHGIDGDGRYDYVILICIYYDIFLYMNCYCCCCYFYSIIVFFFWCFADRSYIIFSQSSFAY